MRLHLLRHAEPLLFSNNSQDKTRELAQSGRNQCERLRGQLSRDWSNTALWCSTATRTLQTMRHSLDISSFHEVHLLDDLYNASLTSLLAFLSDTAHSNDVFIIGHNNGLSEMLLYFTDLPIMMQTGHYVCIDFLIDQWQETSRGLGSLAAEFVP